MLPAQINLHRYGSPGRRCPVHITRRGLLNWSWIQKVILFVYLPLATVQTHMVTAADKPLSARRTTVSFTHVSTARRGITRSCRRWEKGSQPLNRITLASAVFTPTTPI